MECDLVQYENKVETTMRIHLWNLMGENSLKDVLKSSQKYYLWTNVTCIGMSIWKNQTKAQGFGLVCKFHEK